MNRFAGATREERTALVVAAIQAHRERASPYVTFETQPDPEAAPPTAEREPGPPPWIQYRASDGQLNLDCRAAELDSIQDALGRIGGVTITDQQSVEGGATNLRIPVPGDDERVAHVIETLLIEGFGLPEDVRLWAAEI